jgi:hypothetical protein
MTEDKFLVVFAVMWIVLFLSVFGHCTTSHPNSLGSTSYTINPNIYVAVDNVIEVTDVDGNLNLRIHPVGTFMLYDENVLLCGQPFDRFAGFDYPMMITYERVAHRAVEGVGCHELRSVDQIVPKTAMEGK